MFVNSDYKQQIISYVQGSDLSTHDDRIQSICDRFLKHIEFEGAPDFPQKCQAVIKRIAQTKPGMELFTRILAKIVNWKIIEMTEGSAVAFPLKKLVFFNLNERHFYVRVSSTGEKSIAEGPTDIIVAHEFIHIMHFLEKESENQRRSENKFRLVDPTMDDEEEQLTITGLACIDPSQTAPCKTSISHAEGSVSYHGLTDLVCENSFLAAWGLQPRINHQGFDFTPPTLVDMVKVNALESIREKLSQVNVPQYHKGQGFERRITPLSAAAFHGHKALVELFLANGAVLDAEDEIGGALHAAVTNGQIDMALHLVDLGINRNLKNQEGKTVLEKLLSGTARFCEIKKPLIKKLQDPNQGKVL